LALGARTQMNLLQTQDSRRDIEGELDSNEKLATATDGRRQTAYTGQQKLHSDNASDTCGIGMSNNNKYRMNSRTHNHERQRIIRSVQFNRNFITAHSYTDRIS